MGELRMHRKSVRVLGVGTALALAFFGYTNCAPQHIFQEASEINEASSSQNDTQTSSEKIDVSGGLITRDIGAGCNPGPISDFIEAENPLVKRVEPRNCALLKINTPVIS
jgi:hypothetical protein